MALAGAAAKEEANLADFFFRSGGLANKNSVC